MYDFSALTAEAQKLIDAAVAPLNVTIASLNKQIADLKALPPSNPPPTAFVWPNATNTGTPAGTALTAYTGPTTITIDGTVIDSKTIPTALTIKAKNVTISKCSFTSSAWSVISCDGAVGLTVDRCTINGLGKTAGSYGINGSGTFTNNNIFGVENGISPGSNSVVKGNFIHALQAGGADPHYDGIPLHGQQSNVLIEDNTVLARDNAAVFITNDFGAISNVTVNHNKFLVEAIANMSGPNANPPVYTVYIDGRKASGGAITGITLTNNIIQKGIYGSVEISQAAVTRSGNVDPAGNPV